MIQTKCLYYVFVDITVIGTNYKYLPAGGAGMMHAKYKGMNLV